MWVPCDLHARWNLYWECLHTSKHHSQGYKCGSVAYLVPHKGQAGELLEACQGAEPCGLAAAEQCIQLACKGDVGQVGQVLCSISQGLAHIRQLLDREACGRGGAGRQRMIIRLWRKTCKEGYQSNTCFPVSLCIHPETAGLAAQVLLVSRCAARCMASLFTPAWDITSLCEFVHDHCHETVMWLDVAPCMEMHRAAAL
jgi:hypothetical protein